MPFTAQAGPGRPASIETFFSIFAHVSFSATVRLKTGLPDLESGSAQQYPKRSHWYLTPICGVASEGSSLASRITCNELGLRLEVKSFPESTWFGSSLLNRVS